MILSFINICKVPRGILKTSGFALGFQHLPRDLANVNEWKIRFDPYIAKYYINICKGTNKHLIFLEYKINVQSIFQSHKEMALKNNELQEFLEAWVPYKKLLNNN